MTRYTIKVRPSQSPGKITATSSDGHTLTTSMCILDGARYWQGLVAPSSATIVTVWSSGLDPRQHYDSPTVGMPGSTSERVAAVTASARSLPALIYPIDETVVGKKTCTCPPSRSLNAGPPPR